MWKSHNQGNLKLPCPLVSKIRSNREANKLTGRLLHWGDRDLICAAGHTATATGFGGFGGRPCRSEVAAEDLLALPKKRVEERDGDEGRE